MITQTETKKISDQLAAKIPGFDKWNFYHYLQNKYGDITIG